MKGHLFRQVSNLPRVAVGCTFTTQSFVFPRTAERLVSFHALCTKVQGNDTRALCARALVSQQRSAFQHNSVLVARFQSTANRCRNVYNQRFCSNTSKQQEKGFTEQGPNPKEGSTNSSKTETVEKLWSKLKRKAKEYGKTFIVVHYVSTYTIWFGSFYYLSYMGMNIRWILEKLKTSEEKMQRIENSRYTHAAVAYVLVKITSPVRFVASMGLTELAVRALRARGYLPAVNDSDKFSDLVRNEVRARVAHIRRVHKLRVLRRAKERNERYARLKGHATSVGKKTFRAIASRWKWKPRFKLTSFGLLRRIPK